MGAGTQQRWLSCAIFIARKPMPAQRSAMRKIKEVLRLKFEAKLSHERIAAATGLSKGAVTNIARYLPGRSIGARNRMSLIAIDGMSGRGMRYPHAEASSQPVKL
jgi:hypothetical protein